MPIFDWTRSDLFSQVGDGSTALYYAKDMIQDDYNKMADYILGFTEKYNMSFPGWEPERMAKLNELFKAYEGVTHEKLWANLKYFLEAIMPTCEECGIKMAIHPDDPPWDIFGLPRLLVNEENIDKFLKLVDNPYNCLTLCSGSLNANPENDVAKIIRKHCDRIAFAHIRNVKHFENGDFQEASHRDCDGDTRILDILKAYHECGFKGYIRPDHGRHLWDEKPGNVRPGYGLYDRALGIMYMLGVIDMLNKLKEN
jgi:mannonate dehydratase